MNARVTALQILPASALAAMLLAPSVGAQTRRMEKRFTVAGRPVVQVQNPAGRIQVKAWDRHEVLVVAQHTSNNAGIQTEQAGNRIEVATIAMPGEASANEDVSTDYQINVPVESELQIRTDSGNVTVESVH